MKLAGPDGAGATTVSAGHDGAGPIFKVQLRCSSRTYHLVRDGRTLCGDGKPPWRVVDGRGLSLCKKCRHIQVREVR